MTSRSKLVSIFLAVLLTVLLSIAVYMQNPLQLMKATTVGNFQPRQRHVSGIAVSTALPDALQNITGGSMSAVAEHQAAKPTRDFMAINSKEQQKRRTILHEACKKQRATTPFHIPGGLFVDHEYKVIYCSVPKIACTNWKKVFLVLNKSFKSTKEISQYYANRDGQKQLTKLRDLPAAEIKKALATYTKFMFARHPLSRVLSAFRNKLAPESTFERALLWQRTVGKRILGKYRQSKVPKNEYNLTFEEFIRYLTDPEVPRKESTNKHWAKMFDQCRPCDIDYDIIGKFESLKSDSEYILKVIHAEKVGFPGSESSSPTGSSNQTKLEEYYKNVPLTDLQRLYERYKVDFDLFGYDPPTLAFKGS